MPSDESNTPFFPSCSSSLLPSCEYFCTIPDGELRDPDIALGVEVTRVQARIDHLQVAPGMDDVPSGIEFDEGRSEARRVQIALIHVLAIQNQHVILASTQTPPSPPSAHWLGSGFGQERSASYRTAPF